MYTPSQTHSIHTACLRACALQHLCEAVHKMHHKPRWCCSSLGLWMEACRRRGRSCKDRTPLSLYGFIFALCGQPPLFTQTAGESVNPCVPYACVCVFSVFWIGSSHYAVWLKELKGSRVCLQHLEEWKPVGGGWGQLGGGGKQPC